MTNTLYNKQLPTTGPIFALIMSRTVNRFFYSLAWVVFFSSSLWSDSTAIVTEIRIVGEQKTKEYIIRREIHHPLGVQLDSTIAAADRNRIENLGIFSGAYWEVVPNGHETMTLTYRVVESWRIMPGAMPIYEEDKGWSLTGGVIIKNFRGRNEALNFGGTIGAVNDYGIEFLDPWIFGDHVSLSVQTGKQSFGHPFLPYDQSTVSFGVDVGRYFGYERKLSAGFELERKSFIGTEDTLTYTYFAPKGLFMYDTRDVYTDPSRGVLIIHNLYTMLDLTGRDLNSSFWYQSYSVYKTLIPGSWKLTLGLNMGGSLTFGKLEEVWMNYLGGVNTVRGWQVPTREIYQHEPNHFRFGHHWVVSSAELRQTIIPRFVTRWKSEFGLIAAGFFDIGYAGMTLGTVPDGPSMMSVGFGVRMPIAIAGILRFDYAWSFGGGTYEEQAFHFGIGQKF